MFNNLLGQAQRFLEKKKKQLRPVVQAVQKKLQPITSAIGNIIPKAPPVSPPLRNIPRTFTKPVVQPVSKPLFTPTPKPVYQTPKPDPVRPTFLQSASKVVQKAGQFLQKTPEFKPTFVPSKPSIISKSSDVMGKILTGAGSFGANMPGEIVRSLGRVAETVGKGEARSELKKTGELLKQKKYLEALGSRGTEVGFEMFPPTSTLFGVGGIVRAIGKKAVIQTGKQISKQIVKKEVPLFGKQIVSKNAPPLLGKVAQQVEKKGSQLFKSIKGAPREKQAQILADIMEKETNRGQLFGKATPRILPPVENYGSISPTSGGKFVAYDPVRQERLYEPGKGANIKMFNTEQEAQQALNKLQKSRISVPPVEGGVGGVPTNKDLAMKALERQQPVNSKPSTPQGGVTAYHGGNVKRDVLDFTKAGSKEQGFGAKSGMWFTKSKSTARGYGKEVMETKLDLKNPRVIDAKGKMYGDMRDIIDEQISLAKKQGHDGVIIKNLSDEKNWGQYKPTDHYVVFEPKSIKPPVEGGVTTPPVSPIVKSLGGGEVGQVAERGLVKPKATLFGKEAKIEVPSFKNGISPQATTPLQQTIVPSKKQISPPLNESIPDLKPRQTILNKIGQMKKSIANDEAYELALNMPTKSEMVIPRIKEIAELKVLKGKAKQVRDLVYNSELDPNIKFYIVKDNGRALEITANQDYREWQTQVFKQAGTRTTGEVIDDITGMIKNKTVSPMARDVENLKDISGFSAQTRDVFRNFKAVYGKRFEEVKPLLDKFINSKGKFIDDLDNWANKVHKEIEINLGIKKGTRLSAAVQEFGEGSLDQRTLIKELGEDKANKVTQADMWFRVAYDQLLSEVNVVRARIYPNDPTKIIPRRQDYYRHFRDLQQGFSGLVNIFDTPANIESSLSGVSEFTKPKSKWLSFAQKRLGLQTEVDAVGGFLDYIKASSYAKNIDPNISTFRNLAEELAQETLEGPNKGKLNNFIEFLQDFSNDLSGKTNPADRFIQKVIPGGRKAFRVINWMNNRVKANVILGNLSSSIAQIFNVPQGMASVQNPVYWIKGLGDSLASMFVKNQPIEQSIFLKERNFNSFDQFDRGMLNSIKKFAVWSIKVLDEIGSKYIWNMHYEKALAEQIANPISYADDLTRDLVAGRGI